MSTATKIKHLLEPAPEHGRIQLHRLNVKNDSRLEGLIKMPDLAFPVISRLERVAFSATSGVMEDEGGGGDRSSFVVGLIENRAKEDSFGSGRGKPSVANLLPFPTASKTFLNVTSITPMLKRCSSQLILSCRYLMGEEPNSLKFKEVQQLEQQLDSSIKLPRS